MVVALLNVLFLFNLPDQRQVRPAFQLHRAAARVDPLPYRPSRASLSARSAQIRRAWLWYAHDHRLGEPWRLAAEQRGARGVPHQRQHRRTPAVQVLLRRRGLDAHA